MAEQIYYLDTMEFDEAFKDMERNRIKFSAYTVLENYPLYHAWSTGNKDYQLDTSYLDSVKGFIKEDEKLLVLKEYQEGMASLVSVISTSRLKEYDAYKRVMAQFDYVIHNLTNSTLIEFLIDHYAYNYLLGAGVDEHMGTILRTYDTYVKDVKMFIAVACDKDRAMWEKRVRENPKGEVQLYMGSDRSFMDFYMIRGIPRFILISPDGRIIDSDMSRPSNPETAKVLRAYLKSSK